MIRKIATHCGTLIAVGPIILRQNGSMRQARTIELLLRDAVFTLNQDDVRALLRQLRYFAEWGSLA
jgi:hypothetical protein